MKGLTTCGGQLTAESKPQWLDDVLYAITHELNVLRFSCDPNLVSDHPLSNPLSDPLSNPSLVPTVPDSKLAFVDTTHNSSSSQVICNFTFTFTLQTTIPQPLSQ